jgi:hypothetical protein
MNENYADIPVPTPTRLPDGETRISRARDVTIHQAVNGYIVSIGCQTYVHEGKAATGLAKLVAYLEKYEK